MKTRRNQGKGRTRFSRHKKKKSKSRQKQRQKGGSYYSYNENIMQNPEPELGMRGGFGDSRYVVSQPATNVLQSAAFSLKSGWTNFWGLEPPTNPSVLSQNL